MGFSVKQIQALRRALDGRFVRTREVNGRELSYIEGWYAISEANRIFGFDGWSRETMETRCVLARENRGSFLAVYTARVRITVHADGSVVFREGHGTGEGRGTSPGEAHDLALKVAETDATKRALATFGRPFGLALYANGKAPGLKASLPKPMSANPLPRVVLPRENAMPTPPPSRHPARREYMAIQEQSKLSDGKVLQSPSADAPLAPSGPIHSPSRIDKSALTFGEPKRLRDKAHLRFVASQPCLVCGRQPSDPHHLRFAQPRALGLKVSDEFTVPLCRGHHRQLHQAGNEAAWWEDLDINALEIAKGLWEESHGRAVVAVEPWSESNAGQINPPISEG
jgi:DNA recombination protein Rad52